MLESRNSANCKDSDSDSSNDSDASSSSSGGTDSDTELGSPVQKRPWLQSSESAGLSSRVAAGEAWRRAFQEGAIDSQLSRAVGFVSGGVPNLDRDSEAYNYKLAPKLPTKKARQAKRRADREAISAAAAAASSEDFSARLDLEEFGLPAPGADAPTAAQIDLRHRLEARKRKRNREKRQGRARRRRGQSEDCAGADGVEGGEAASNGAAAGEGGGDGGLIVDARKKLKKHKRNKGDRDKLNPSDPPEKLAGRLAFLLHEPKRHLIERVINILGASKAIELYHRTSDIESAGGLMITNGDRRRTPGGVYLQLLKSDDSATPDILRRVFDGESSLANEKRKRLRATRRKRQRAGRADAAGETPAAIETADESAALEARRAELLAQLDALEEV